ncbi:MULTISPECIES: hypothetical protein [unclassified Halanaerobium]|uniref:hypothetical protein n=1 Tax=unclassified Halanaerobium TaxID=2641197 RepID=UPI000DF3C4A2|nr:MULTISPECIES: hypothetical protein [unclassified Halanaerobium]RCW51354.1 hypothetical protein DFR78_1013 [Halanaerobium sp. MA284_MarDTE_T2]RCW81447.1 hypothetical protein DER71_12439 [Halanaerobium sp. DL-01]
MAGLFNLGLILSAFGGGVFGAALGALNSFIFCGFLVIAGEAISVASGVGSFTNAIGFGTWFGPHIGFAAGAAAAAYAARKGYVEGRDIITPLMKFKDPSVLLVGGLFGILGYFVNGIIAGVGTPTDTIALTVVISAIIKRVMFSDTGVIGTYNPEHGDSRWSPSEDIAWLPFQMHAGELLMIGLGVGLVSSKISLITGSSFIGFGIAAASLIILSTIGGSPVTHHIALPAALAAMATGSVIVGGIFGILGAFLGEFFARLFYDWGDTHIDPPAATIATLTTVVMLFLQ